MIENKLFIHVSPGGQANFASDCSTIITELNPRPIPKYLSKRPVENPNFIGRKTDKERIKKILTESHKIVIRGIGGIGKTALAKSIYFELEKYYDYIAWIDFKETWEESLSQAVFESCFSESYCSSMGTKYDYVVQFITNTPNILLIIDNLKKNEAETLGEIMCLPCDILITSRNKFVGINEYELEVLPEDEAIKLFQKYYRAGESLSAYDRSNALKIVTNVKRHPLTIELIAKAISYKNLSIEQFLSEWENKDFDLRKINAPINSDWNNSYIEEEICIQIGKIYQLSELSGKEQQIIKLLSLLPAFERINISDIKCWVVVNITSLISSLEMRGWIQREGKTIYMHEVICDYVFRYNMISFSSCFKMLNDLDRKMILGPTAKLSDCIKYATYAYNVISKKREDEKFCRHLFVREAALIFKEIGKYKLSIELLDLIIANYSEQEPKDLLLLAELYNNYSKIFSIQSDLITALSWSLRAEKVIDSISNNTSQEFFLQKMIIKKTVGMQYSNQKKYSSAKYRLDEAIACIPEIEEKYAFQVANLYSDYSLFLYNLGDISACVDNYESAIEKYDQCKIPEDSAWRNTTYTNYADALILADKLDQAMYYQYKSLQGKYQVYESDNHAIANALLGMGDIYREEKRLWDVADIFYQKAIVIFKKNKSSDGYCDCLACRSIVLQDRNLAKEAYEIMMNNAEKVYSAKTYADVVCALQVANPLDAIFVGKRAMEYLETLPISHPTEAYIGAMLAESYYNLGDLLNAQKYLKQATEKINRLSLFYYRKAKDILSELPFDIS